MSRLASASAFALLAAGRALAQQTTVLTITVPEIGASTVFASVVTANPTATQLVFGCPTGATPEECELFTDGQDITVTVGPSMFGYHVVQSFAQTVSAMTQGYSAWVVPGVS
jgi:hypothetical protein